MEKVCDGEGDEEGQREDGEAGAVGVGVGGEDEGGEEVGHGHTGGKGGCCWFGYCVALRSCMRLDRECGIGRSEIVLGGSCLDAEMGKRRIFVRDDEQCCLTMLLLAHNGRVSFVLKQGHCGISTRGQSADRSTRSERKNGLLC